MTIDLEKLKTQGADALKEALDTVVKQQKDGDVLLEGKLQKTADATADAIEGIEALKGRLKGLEEKNKELELNLTSNKLDVTDANKDRAINLQHEAMEMFIRKGGVKSSSEKTDFSNFINDFCEAKKVEVKELGVGRVALDTKGTSLRVGSDVDGGFLTLPEFGGVIKTQQYETSPMRNYANVVTVATDTYEFVDDYDQAASGGWVGETATRSNTNAPSIAKRNIIVHEQYANPYASQKMLEDGIVNVESWLGEKIADILSRTENTAFIAGDGNAKPRGIAAYTTAQSATYTQGQIESVKSGSTTVFAYATLIALQGKLKFPYIQNATWFTNRATLAGLLSVVDGQQRPIFSLNFDKNTMTFGTMFGLPLTVFNDMPVVASAALALGIGDLKRAYTIVDRRGINLLRDPYSHKPYVDFYATKRVGGDVANWEAVKFQIMST